MRLSRLICLALILSPLALFAGCSGGKKVGNPVTGKITMDGKDVVVGSIKFVNPGTGTAKQDVVVELSDSGFEAHNVAIGDAIAVGIDTTKAESLTNLRYIKEQLDEKKKQKADMKKAQDKGDSVDSSFIDEQIEKLQEDLKKGESIAKKFRKVPARYGDPKTSGITVKIVAGSNTLEIPDLKSK